MTNLLLVQITKQKTNGHRHRNMYENEVGLIVSLISTIISQELDDKKNPRYKLIKTKKTRHSFSINNLGVFIFYWYFIKLALDMIVDAVSAIMWRVNILLSWH